MYGSSQQNTKLREDKHVQRRYLMTAHRFTLNGKYFNPTGSTSAASREQLALFARLPNMASWIIQVTLMLLSVCVLCSQAKKDKVLYCSACKAIIDELKYSISQVDPKKTINVGSFRLNPDGTMTDKKVPLARSETHLSELLEGVCNSMSDYALHVDPDTQHKQYLRFAPRSSGATGDFPDFKNFQFDGPEASSALKFACETVVEELEDDIISAFGRGGDVGHQELCNRASDYCAGGSHTNEEL